MSRPHMKLTGGYKAFPGAVTSVAEELCTAAKDAAMVTDPPSRSPTRIPTRTPTELPTDQPTNIPTISPSHNPTAIPSHVPTKVPTAILSITPTSPAPTLPPSHTPSKAPTDPPTMPPSTTPTHLPTLQPSVPPKCPNCPCPSCAPPAPQVACQASSLMGVPTPACSEPSAAVPAPCITCPSSTPSCVTPCKPSTWPVKYAQKEVRKLMEQVGSLTVSLKTLRMEERAHKQQLQRLKKLEGSCASSNSPTKLPLVGQGTAASADAPSGSPSSTPTQLKPAAHAGSMD